jgi:hypothetical protein
VVVADIEPLQLPILFGVLPGGVFAHLHPSASNYSRVIRARLRLQPEELLEYDPVVLDPHEHLAEMHEMETWKILLWLRLRYSIP